MKDDNLIFEAYIKEGNMKRVIQAAQQDEGQTVSQLRMQLIMMADMGKQPEDMGMVGPFQTPMSFAEIAGALLRIDQAAFQKVLDENPEIKPPPGQEWWV